MAEQNNALAGTPVTVQSWWRTQSATMALLKHAHGMIDGAEKRIADLEKKIRELEDLAASDPLTGLMNRRGFEKFFEHEGARIRRGHSPGALFVLIDLDRFKRINDTHGHQAGDECLKIAAKALLETTRIADGAARLGGDEFALLLTQTDLSRAESGIGKIRDRLSSLSLEWSGRRLDFGASIGAAAVSMERTDFVQAYQYADNALYDHKKGRRSGH